ncbi:hypothetical protein ACMAUO_04480 [Gluconacetobacter sp. Hr-1-5]|uniref:hypothetical protein n=1 Tax=Gluconacetobacter sp. Hr-1-5 TaxID=3395370 RepID=UPI003B51E93C
MRLAFALSALLFLPIVAIAGPKISGPWIPTPLHGGLPTIHHALDPHNRIGQTGITLETTRLSDLYRDHVIPTVGHEGDASASHALKSEDVTIAGQARFGTTPGDLVQAFGPATFRRSGHDSSVIMDWRYSQPLSTRPGEGFNTYGDLVARFDHNQMTKVFFSRTTAN